jgi:hypothetical protein
MVKNISGLSIGSKQKSLSRVIGAVTDRIAQINHKSGTKYAHKDAEDLKDYKNDKTALPMGSGRGSSAIGFSGLSCRDILFVERPEFCALNRDCWRCRQLFFCSQL